ncbi:cytochrome P450 [Streptomyces sp. NBC_00654]|uniref:cytochrome P450 n=1 Tax=Streptomyces sp. NBC_00654 TaxID=2975799 RepID=UPI00224F9131|nr:cytochrome P450 [Streptomyces sp. NBC_00654]MCX4965717.1 cytochrome P450 [Streptomyces sp. NBC_00654]
MTDPVSMPHNHRRATCPFRPGPDLVAMHQDPSLRRVPVPNSQLGEVEAVLITREDDARTVLSDARYEVGFAFDPDWSGPRSVMNQPGVLLNYDGDEHTRYRRMQSGAFTMKRIRALSGVIERIVEEHLDAVEKAGPGVDLIRTFAEPLPLMVICELLGAQAEDRAAILERSSTASSIDTTLEVQQDNFAAMTGYMAELVAAHRRDPGDNILGDLVRKHGAELTDDELVGMGLDVLVAGHGTLSGMIGLSALALLSHPEQLALLRDDADDSLSGGAVEELLRLLAVAPPLVRRAATDLSVDDQVIHAGEHVVISTLMANHGTGLTPPAGELDLRRRPVPHLAFGYGRHQCVGQQLARLELRLALPALFRRFPDLRLAVPFEEIEYRTESLVLGVKRLPVVW